MQSKTSTVLLVAQQEVLLLTGLLFLIWLFLFFHSPSICCAWQVYLLTVSHIVDVVLHTCSLTGCWLLPCWLPVAFGDRISKCMRQVPGSGESKPSLRWGLWGSNVWFCWELLSCFLRSLFSHNLVIEAEIQAAELYCFSNDTNYFCLASEWVVCCEHNQYFTAFLLCSLVHSMQMKWALGIGTK